MSLVGFLYGAARSASYAKAASRGPGALGKRWLRGRIFGQVMRLIPRWPR